MTLWTFSALKAGKATTRWPKADGATGQEGVLGMPRYRPEACAEGCRACADACPSAAIHFESDDNGPRLALDYGACVVCQRCVEACPQGAMEPSTDWAFGVRERADLVWAQDRTPPARPAETRGLRRSLYVRHVDAGSCNGCESEIQALNNPFYNLHRLGIFFTASPRFADLLLVTGPVTEAMLEPLKATYEAMAEPRWVVATGTCAVSGAITGGGYTGGAGLENVLPVDVWLPGCPPNPAAIIEALLMFLDRMPQRVTGGRYDK